MSDLPVARRYAQALCEEAARKKRTEKIDQDMALIRESLDASGELVRFFESPIISREKKDTVVVALFQKRVDPLTLKFLRLLVEKRRETLFALVVQAYRALRDVQLGIISVEARTAQPLDEAEEKKLVQTLETMTKKRVRLQVTLAPDLIGGLIIRVGDTVYDGSVRNQLVTLRERLEKGTFMMN